MNETDEVEDEGVLTIGNIITLEYSMEGRML